MPVSEAGFIDMEYDAWSVDPIALRGLERVAGYDEPHQLCKL